MSTSISENREYFIKALNEVINERIEEELEGCEEDASSTLRHKVIMKRIASGKYTDREDIVRARKRGVLIAIIAAMLALTSCALAIVYREKIGGFIENVFEDFVEVSPDNENQDNSQEYPSKIEKVYEFTYIPEGYELEKEDINSFAVILVYKNNVEKALKIKQMVVNSSGFKINSENNYRNVFDVGEIQIYYRDDYVNIYAFKQDGYIFQIHSDDKLSNKELTKIILNIK